MIKKKEKGLYQLADTNNQTVFKLFTPWAIYIYILHTNGPIAHQKITGTATGGSVYSLKTQEPMIP